jgi:hypothetical protein
MYSEDCLFFIILVPTCRQLKGSNAIYHFKNHPPLILWWKNHVHAASEPFSTGVMISYLVILVKMDWFQTVAPPDRHHGRSQR